MASELLKMGIKRDLIVESNGICFICLNRSGNAHQLPNFIKSEWGNTSPSNFKIYSLHCLSKFLRMDLRKVFKEETVIPTNLLTKVEKSALKAELCDKCASLHDNFLKLHQQLAKIRLEVLSSLNDIHEKFTETAGRGRTTNFNMIAHNPNNDEWRDKLDILEILRTEAIQKCSAMISSTPPRIKVENLSMKEVSRKKIKLQQSPLSSLISSHPADISQCIKTEYQIENSSLDENDDTSNYSDGMGTSGYDHTFANIDEGDSNRVEGERCHPIGKRVTRGNSNSLKLKIKCPSCEKEFANKWSYVEHYKNIHKRIGVKCHICNRHFARKDRLRAHLRRTSCGMGKAPKHICWCKLCGKGFTVLGNLKKHMIEIHLGPQKISCDLCPKEFNHKRNLVRHKKAHHNETN